MAKATSLLVSDIVTGYLLGGDNTSAFPTFPDPFSCIPFISSIYPYHYSYLLSCFRSYLLPCSTFASIQHVTFLFRTPRLWSWMTAIRLFVSYLYILCNVLYLESQYFDPFFRVFPHTGFQFLGSGNVGKAEVTRSICLDMEVWCEHAVDMLPPQQ